MFQTCNDKLPLIQFILSKIQDTTNSCNQLQNLLRDERLNGRQLVRKDELYLSSKEYEVFKSFLEIKFHPEDKDGSERWKPYRDSKLCQVCAKQVVFS